MLTLKIERENGTSHSIGRYRVFSTGILSESGDRSDDGQAVTQRVTVETIGDDGVTLTFEMYNASGKDFRREIFVGYGGEAKTDLPNGSTLVATLKPHE